VVCHRRQSAHNGNRDGPQLPDGKGDDADNQDDRDNATANGVPSEGGSEESDAYGVLYVSRLFAEEHHLASRDRVHVKPLVKQALTLDRVVLVAQTASAYRFATKKGTLSA
jgi:hypothetical protein